MKKIIVIFALLLLPLAVGASFDNNLYYGLQNNNEVKELQEFLTEQKVYDGPITGNFYSLTLKAVKDFQKKENISPTSGFFGPLTRTKANEILFANVEPSNQQAVQETGTTPPTPEPAKTTNDVVKSLQDQIALLLQQIQAMQTQQTTLNQIQQNTQQTAQNTQQIAQNTTPPTTCNPVWQCGNWSSCTNSQQSRSCWDSNGCGTTTGKPSETQSCTVSCSPNWQCGNWTTCTNSQQTRSCTDSNNCGILTGKPSETQSCTPVCSPSWTCGSWSNCTNAQQSRSCTDSNRCGVLIGKPSETQACTPPPIYISVSNYNNNPVYANKGTKIVDFLVNFNGVSNTNISKIRLNITGDSVNLIKNLTFYNYPDFDRGQPKTILPSLVSGNEIILDNLNIPASGNPNSSFSNRLLLYADLQNITSDTSITINLNSIDATGDGNQIIDIRNFPLSITTTIKKPYLTVKLNSSSRSGYYNSGNSVEELQTFDIFSTYNRIELTKIGLTVSGGTVASTSPSCPFASNSNSLTFCLLGHALTAGPISATSGIPVEVGIGNVTHVFDAGERGAWPITAKTGGTYSCYSTNTLACSDVGTNWKITINSAEAIDYDTGRTITAIDLPVESGVVNFRLP